MLKKRTNTAIATLAIGFVFLTSCYSSQQLVQPSLAANVAGNPQYLTNLALHGPSKSLAISPEMANSAEPSGLKLPQGAGCSIQAKYASLLGVMPETICNLSLYHFIDEWYGVRYRLGGTSKKGIDCSAFMQKVYESVFGMNLVRTAIEQFNKSRLVFNRDQCKEGDLVFFNVHGGGISHVGLYLANHFFVHASSSHGIMISSLDDSYWKKRFSGAGRVL